MKKSAIKNMSLVSLGAVFIAVGAWITVPFLVPFTMQTFSVFLHLFVFGGKIGCSSIFLYIGLGMVGLPVFSGGGSGISALYGATGGYIIGFAVAGCAYLALQSIFIKYQSGELWFSFVLLALCYACGTLWYTLVYANNSVGIIAALSYCVLPYVVPDVIKIIAAYLLSKRLKKVISR